MNKKGVVNKKAVVKVYIREGVNE